MMQYWILCRSLTHAQRAAKLLERSGFTAIVTKAPQGLNTKGCGYAVSIRKKVEEAIRILDRYGLPYGKIYQRLNSEEFREVEL